MSQISRQRDRVLDAFEAWTDNWTFHDFDSELETSMGKYYGNYQTVKMTIKEAKNDGRWPRTVERYVRKNYEALGSLPSELNEIGLRLGARRSPKPKA